MAPILYDVTCDVDLQCVDSQICAVYLMVSSSACYSIVIIARYVLNFIENESIYSFNLLSVFVVFLS